jgi:hypothetical protein
MRRIWLAPLVFAFFPLISLYLHNREQVPRADAFFSAGFVLLVWLIVVTVTYAIIRDWAKTALLASVFLALFFAYGHVINWLTLVFYRYDALRWAEFLVNRRSGNLLLLAVWAAIFILFTLLIKKSRSDLSWMVSFFNITSVVILVFLAWDWLKIEQKEDDQALAGFVTRWDEQAAKDFPLAQGSTSRPGLPDIYYIILDGYARADVLQEVYAFDNSEFTSFLEDQGFYLAGQSRTNYPQTVCSLSSSLNMTYLDDLPGQVGEATRDLSPLQAMTSHNRVFARLRQEGYLIRNISSGFFFTEDLDVEVTEAPEYQVSALQGQLLSLTPYPIFADLLGLSDPYDLHRERIRYALQHLRQRPETERPVFTFSHIVAPHPPFVFDAGGGEVQPVGAFSIFDGDQYAGSQEDYLEGFRQQTIFVNQEIKQVITDILGNSSRPVIIVLQSDHGPGSRLVWKDWERSYLPERMSILNAYYFPDGDYSHLYPSITPVNSFRVILSQFFAEAYPLLADRNYFASLGSPYYYIEITDRLQAELDQ